MGYNSVLFLCNDAMSEIDKDPAGWWKKAKLALMQCVDGEPREFGHGCHVNGFTAVSNMHADNGVLILAGGNTATVLRRAYGKWKHTPQDIVDVLKQTSEAYGHRLVRMPKDKLKRLLHARETTLAQRGPHPHRRARRLLAQAEYLKRLQPEE